MSCSEGLVTAVVVPAYRVKREISRVLEGMPACVDHVIVVDDACPEGSGESASSVAREDGRIEVIFHEKNLGVGGAVKTGYRRALELGADIVVKMDGDDQMDPEALPELIGPLAEGRAGYAKGNRFRDLRALGNMPALRLAGNSVLSFLLKAASGYWHIMDPTNGYTAIDRRTLERLELERLADGYYFESDMLCRLYLLDVAIEDISMPARYGPEQSSLSIPSSAWSFPPRLLRALLRRVFIKYFIQDFNMVSVYLLLGLPLFLFGVIFGVAEWIESVSTGIPRTAGTIMLSALPVIVGFEMLLQAISIDIFSEPRPLSKGGRL